MKATTEPARRLSAASVLLLFCALATPAVAGGDPGVEIAPGTSRQIVLDERAGPFRRSFRLHVPASFEDDRPRPLVLALHGGLATARILERQTGLSELADRDDFLVVYPNGLGVFSLFRHWNGGYCCAKALASGLDDVAFLDRVVDWVAARYTIDPQRLYVIGYSNGGMLAYRYAAERSDKLAGLGIWASSIGSLETAERSWSLPVPAAAVPAFIAHGNADDRLPFETPGDRADGGERLLGAVGSAAAWAGYNGCEDAPISSSARDGHLERRTWCGAGASPVVLLEVEEWGHDWPGPRGTGKLPSTHPLGGFHLAEEMWDFLRQHQGPATATTGGHRDAADSATAALK